MKYTPEYLLHLAEIRLEQENKFPFKNADDEGIALFEKSMEILQKLERADKNEKNNLKKLNSVNNNGK